MSLQDTIEKVAGESVETFDAEAVNKKEVRELYAARKKIHPKRASGFFRTLKWWIMGITLGVYYLTPWLRWFRGPDAPDQAVLIDLAHRRFYFFFIEIWPHEFFFVAGLLVMAGIGLFLITSTLGRAWCGYTCPQTVWVDLFLVVERFFEGDRNARIKLDAAPWDASKIYKRSAKHIVWVLIAISTGGAWIFYFADAPTLFVDVFTLNAPFVAYATIGVLAATTYIFGGMMREQVCTYMCPWPRVQAAMLDENSLTVTYNDWRGEPRDRHAKRMRAKGELIGDCVDCNACVAACPMGIDIRDGQQLECITCALCIDACDSVMGKLGMERGLISYATLDEYRANMGLAGASITDGKVSVPAEAPGRVRNKMGKLVDEIYHTNIRSFIRPRTLLYSFIYAGIGLGLLFALGTRSQLEVNVLHDRNPLFVTLSDGSIRNGYTVKILNMKGEALRFELKMEGLPEATMKLAGTSAEGVRSLQIDVEADKLRAQRIYVSAPKSSIKAQQTDFKFTVVDLEGGETAESGARFEAPKDLK